MLVRLLAAYVLALLSLGDTEKNRFLNVSGISVVAAIF